jgi:serine/threonine-protein kinase
VAEPVTRAPSSNDPFGIVGTVQSRVFRVERKVAEGGFGVVYRAHHEAFRAPVALKCLKVPESLSSRQRDEFLEKFRTEAELLFRLSAALPEIVRPLQFGVLDTAGFVPFLALEWLEGDTLDALVRKRAVAGKKPLGLAEAVELLTPVARALSRAHHFTEPGGGAVAIIHRDMKPENVFVAIVDGQRMPKILDFGIARVKDETSAIAGRQTQGDGVNAFSPAYAAPEQWYPDAYGGAGPWTDVYGMALTLTEVLIGKPPIEGDITAMMGAALNPDPRPTPRAKGAQISDAAEKAFKKALAVEPKERTASIDAFWLQLEASLGRSPSFTLKRNAATLEDEPEIKKLPSLAPPPMGRPSPATDPPPDRPAAPLRVAEPPQPSAKPSAPPALDLDVSRGSPLSLDLDRSMPAPSARRRPPELGPGFYRPALGPSKSLGERFSGPAWLVFLAIAVGAADYFLSADGQRFMIGPARLVWIAGALGALGVIMAISRAFDE